MVTLIVIAAVLWIVGSLATGLGVARVIAKADVDAELLDLVHQNGRAVSH